MTTVKKNRDGERGATLLEFVIAAPLFFMMLVAIVAGGMLFYTHNALVEATRRGARYAVLHATTTNDGAVRNVVVYGTATPADGQTTLIPNLTTGNVTVTPSNLGVAQGQVTVSITNYQYPFVIPFVSVNVSMPPYSTTLTGECAGNVPADQ